MQATKILTDETLRELTKHGENNFPFAFYSEEINKYEKGYIEWHWHHEFELVYVKRGTAYCHIESKTITLNAGCAIFINSRVFHKFSSEADTSICDILYLPEFISPENSSIYTEYVHPVIMSGCMYFTFDNTEEPFREIISLLGEVFENAKHGSTIDIKISVLTLWKNLFECIKKELSSPPEGKNILLQTRTLTMVQFIEKHYREKITLKDIAKAGDVSKSEALRCFQAMFGTPPIQFLIQYRLNRAKDLLMTTGCSVTKAALDSGIDNISYFVRAFSKHFGVTPKKFSMQHIKPHKP